MAEFVALNIFKEFYTDLDLYSDEGLDELRERLNGQKGRSMATALGVSNEGLTELIRTLRSSQTILFQSWIQQNENLLTFLKGEVKDKFKDVGGLLSHRYIDAFKQYVSPYVTSVLLSKSAKNDAELAVLFSYAVLLHGDDKALVESQLFKPVRQRLRLLEAESVHFTEEQQLIDAIKPMCSDDLIFIVNSLSKASYALKLDYVDTIVNAVRTRGCTVRFANWIFKQMEQLQLNNEHNKKILELKKELKEGRLQVRNHGSGKTPIRWRSILTFLFVLILGGGAFYIIYFKPFSEVEGPEVADTSSFKKFTKEEREKIDSLIQSMGNPLLPEVEEIDPGIPIGNGANLILRKQSKNSLMENIYDDLSKDATNQINQPVDSCELKRQKFKRYSGVKDLEKRTAKVEAVIKNESDYDVLLYVAQNKSGGGVYSSYLKQGSTKVIQLNEGDIILAVAGNTYVPYVAPANYTASTLPSQNFQYHFCDTDANYEETINSSYEYVDTSRKKTKFMIMGRKGSYFRLIDIYSVLAPY